MSSPREIGEANRLRVYRWFVANPCHTIRDCAAALGLSEIAVGRHARSIREGWRPDTFHCDGCNQDVTPQEQAECPLGRCGALVDG